MYRPCTKLMFLTLLFARPLFAAETLNVSLTTVGAAGTNSKNIVSVWIEDNTGAFKKSIGLWAKTRRNDLGVWNTASPIDCTSTACPDFSPNNCCDANCASGCCIGTVGASCDAYMGATRAGHGTIITTTWDMKDYQGNPVPNGTYRVRMELTNEGSSTYRDATFTFNKNGTSSSQTGLSSSGSTGGFNNVTIDYTVTAGDPGTLQFDATTYSGVENSGAVTISVTRVGGNTGAVSVDYTTANATANSGSDYTTASGTLNFADGDVGPHTFDVTLLDDAAIESNETINLTLSNVVGALLGSPGTATVTIVDDDNPAPGSLQFTVTSANFGESDGNAVVSVERTSGVNGAVTVSYQTQDGSATSGSDYAGTSGTLNFAALDAGPKTISVPISEDTAVEGSEVFSIVLSNPTGGATLGTASSIAITITDNDGGGGSSGGLCGDGAMNGDELCDGNDFGMHNCQVLGFVGGDLTCSSDCLLNATGCISAAQATTPANQPLKGCANTLPGLVSVAGLALCLIVRAGIKRRVRVSTTFKRR